MLPFIGAALVVAHLHILHSLGSGGAPTAAGSATDGDAFIVYYYKDTVPILCM